jgi:hypothetical protein
MLSRAEQIPIEMHAQRHIPEQHIRFDLRFDLALVGKSGY